MVAFLAATLCVGDRDHGPATHLCLSLAATGVVVAAAPLPAIGRRLPVPGAPAPSAVVADYPVPPPRA